MSSPIRRYLPHLIVGLSISLLMIGAYAAVGFAASSQPKALWSTNPLTITFAASTGTGSATDSFKCAPPTTGVTLKASVSGTGASKVSLTASPSTFASCGPPYQTVTLTAHCLVPATTCKGTWSGTVTITRGYQTIPPSLAVNIVVT
ncbi:MAG: hypothetical protein AUJ07_02005 [Crenarchaeota archaeon 13_1_40CM_3_53_5]|nr:MAG: hypothetical protein AUJ07_02005 [Crenarchaeota archaeon 13_1_40CM_3_53_5]